MTVATTRRARHRLLRLLVSALLLAGLARALPAGVARAAGFEVTTTADSGAGSLRQAILDANAAAGADTITFASGLTGTITLTSGDLVISDSLTIEGPGADVLVVSGGHTTRIFHVNPGVTLDLSNITLRDGNGTGTGDNFLGFGGAIVNDHGAVTITNSTLAGNSADIAGGGIFNHGVSGSATLTITNSTLSDNFAEFGGGAIYNSGLFGSATATITNSTLSGNFAASGGGAIYNDGRSDSGTVTITNSTLSGNSAGEGGGILNDRGTLTITNSTLSGNSAFTLVGGGIYNYGGSEGSGTVTITNSTFSGNRSAGIGGGIFNSGRFGSATATITNSTFSGNRAGHGGGIYNDGFNGSATMTLTTSTLSGNSAGRGGGIYNNGTAGSATMTLSASTLAGNSADLAGGGIFNDSPSGNATVTLSASIIANDPGDNCVNNVGVLASLGDNLSNDATCNLTAAGDQPTTDPLLGPLADNGGPTQTQALLPGSPAIDAIPLGVNGCGTTLTADQRAIARPQGAACDAGAYEVEVSNVAPAIEAITPATSDPLPITSSLDLTVSFSDPDTADTHTLTIAWGDGSSTSATLPTGDRSVSASHSYAMAGVYTLAVQVSDGTADDGDSYQYVVVYDPSAGFVTGGGWVWSPEGAYLADPALDGKATFGFVSKYQKGKAIPSGNTAFEFEAGELGFESSAYQWLVIAGARAQLKGSGTINGTGSYGFLLTAIDGQRHGGGGVDRFRIKIWELATGAIVYDNQLGDADGADPTTALGGGSIVVHTK